MLLVPWTKLPGDRQAHASFAGDVAFYKTAEGTEHLKGSIQDVLDWYRDNDIAAEVRRRQDGQNRRRRPEIAQLTLQSASEVLLMRVSLSEDSCSCSAAVNAHGHIHEGDSILATEFLVSKVHPCTLKAQPGHFWAMLACPEALVRTWGLCLHIALCHTLFKRQHAEPSSCSYECAGFSIALMPIGRLAGASDRSGSIDLSLVGPLEVSMEQVLCVADEGTVAALLRVTALKSTPSNTWGLSSLSGYPLR